jgi:hypothetical protein
MRPSGESNQLGSYGQVPSKVQSVTGAIETSYGEGLIDGPREAGPPKDLD